MNVSPTASSGYPDWFKTALSTPSESGKATVEGCVINFVCWGEKSNPGIVLLHGSNAHLEWWRAVAPMLCDQFRVVAMDSSGSGKSGWRDQYSRELFAKEVMGVAKEAGLNDNFYVVGHSFGAFSTLEAGYLFGEHLGGIVLVDFAIQPPDRVDEFLEMRKSLRDTPIRPTRVYADKNEALSRFRLVPPQECKNGFLIDYIAQHSLREVEGGWTWRFDPGMFRNLAFDDGSQTTQSEKLNSLKCPSAFIMAQESSDYTEQSAVYTREITKGIIPMFSVPGTFHHLMFDEPIAVAMAIKSLLLSWQCR